MAKQMKPNWNTDMRTPWDEFPMVQLYQALKTKGLITEAEAFFNGVEHNAATSKTLLQKGQQSPRTLYIQKAYKGHTISIAVRRIQCDSLAKSMTEWDTAPKFGAHVRRPYFGGNERGFDSDNPTKSIYVNGMVRKIAVLIERAEPVVDEEIETEVTKVARATADKKSGVNLREELNVDLKQNNLYSSVEYEYGNKAYGMTFTTSRGEDGLVEDETLISIDRIRGTFTVKEIKKIIEIVGGNPRAIAHRLHPNK